MFLFIMSGISVNHIVASFFFLFSRYSLSNQLFLCGLSSFHIIFPSALFIPLWFCSMFYLYLPLLLQYFVHMLLPS